MESLRKNKNVIYENGQRLRHTDGGKETSPDVEGQAVGRHTVAKRQSGEHFLGKSGASGKGGVCEAHHVKKVTEERAHEAGIAHTGGRNDEEIYIPRCLFATAVRAHCEGKTRVGVRRIPALQHVQDLQPICL